MPYNTLCNLWHVYLTLSVYFLVHFISFQTLSDFFNPAFFYFPLIAGCSFNTKCHEIVKSVKLLQNNPREVLDVPLYEHCKRLVMSRQRRERWHWQHLNKRIQHRCWTQEQRHDHSKVSHCILAELDHQDVWKANNFQASMPKFRCLSSSAVKSGISESMRRLWPSQRFMVHSLLRPWKPLWMATGVHCHSHMSLTHIGNFIFEISLIFSFSPEWKRVAETATPSEY